MQPARPRQCARCQQKGNRRQRERRLFRQHPKEDQRIPMTDNEFENPVHRFPVYRTGVRREEAGWPQRAAAFSDSPAAFLNRAGRRRASPGHSPRGSAVVKLSPTARDKGTESRLSRRVLSQREAALEVSSRTPKRDRKDLGRELRGAALSRRRRNGTQRFSPSPCRNSVKMPAKALDIGFYPARINPIKRYVCRPPAITTEPRSLPGAMESIMSNASIACRYSKPKISSPSK